MPAIMESGFNAVTLAILIVPLFLFLWIRSRSSFNKAVNKIPGPYAFPIIGNVLVYIRTSPVELFQRLMTEIAQPGNLIRVWLFNLPQVLICSARDAEVILKDMKHHVKSDNYELLHAWMGRGLLTSRDEMWRVHRKVLTPAFHFNILHEFLPIFCRHALKLTQRLADEPAAMSKQGFNIFPYSSLCSLDIICESSMGKDLKAQDKDNRAYVNAVNSEMKTSLEENSKLGVPTTFQKLEKWLKSSVSGAIRLSDNYRLLLIHSMNDLLTYRYFTPWLRPEFLYQFSSTKRAMDANLKLINDFTDQVITERKEYVKCIKRAEQGDSGENVAFGIKRRMAFLDLLLTAEADGSQFMTQKDIRDQVSTFMFEGHDTVSTATCWVLFILGTYPDAQRRVVEELEEVFGDSGRAPEMADLANLKYLERCIKETLRLYPSVAFYERNIKTDAKLDQYTVPAGCTVSFLTYLIHRDPEFWPDPEKFDPDRFLPENSQGRHPYAYVPFSAGPRNCIGQKFALLEEKVVVSTVLRRFRVEAAHSREEAQLQIGLVLRPRDGLRIRLFDRDDFPKLRVSY